MTNVAYNCIDRHLAQARQPDRDHLGRRRARRSKLITYAELYEQVDQFANVLKWHGVKKGDRVTIYLPMIPEAAYAMLACARIGAIHSVVFGGFSPDALAGPHRRRQIGRRRSPPTRACAAAARCRSRPTSTRRWRRSTGVKHVSSCRHTGGDVAWNAGPRRLAATRRSSASRPIARPSRWSAEDPLFILYTSGSTGTPKGVLHTTGGYLVYAAMTHQYVFDYHEGDVYWCTADVGWVTGHSYIVYGPLANGATTLMFEGVPNYPERQPLLGGHRQAQGQHLLHRADRHPLADERRAKRR